MVVLLRTDELEQKSTFPISNFPGQKNILKKLFKKIIGVSLKMKFL